MSGTDTYTLIRSLFCPLYMASLFVGSTLSADLQLTDIRQGLWETSSNFDIIYDNINSDN